MWEVYCDEGWALTNWCFWTVVLEKTLESPLDCKEIHSVHHKGDQSWLFFGRTDVEAESPILGYLMRRADSLGKTLVLGMIEGGRRRGWQRTRWLESESKSEVTQLCPTLCDPMGCSMLGLPVHHQLEFTQTHVHWVGDAIQPSHPLSSPYPPALNLSQHQSLFQWVSSSHEMAQVLELQLQRQSFQWISRTDFL